MMLQPENSWNGLKWTDSKNDHPLPVKTYIKVFKHSNQPVKYQYDEDVLASKMHTH